jgi:hypothetical protein
LVLTSSTPINPAASSAETSSTNGARGGAFRGRTTRNVDGALPGTVAGIALAGAVVAAAASSPSMAAAGAVDSGTVDSGAVTSANGSALTRPA